MCRQQGKIGRSVSQFFRAYPFVGIFVCTACIILCAYYTHFPFHPLSDTEADYLDSSAVYRVQVLLPPVLRSNSVQIDVRLLGMYSGDSVRRLDQQAVLRLQTDSMLPDLQVGDILLARTRLQRPQPPFAGDFDYGRYLRMQHMVGVGAVQAGCWRKISHAPVRSLKASAALLQHRLAARYARAGMYGRPLALMSALTLGERDGLDSDLRQSFAAAGAAHVLAVSGLHTGFIFGILLAVFTLFGLRRPLYEERTKRWLLSITIVLLMWLYAFLTGLSPSVMRAVVMLTIGQIGWACRREALSLNTLAAAACICLWSNPLALFSVSFQLSFSAVVGILLFDPYLVDLFPKWRNKAAWYMRNLITVSVAATIGTLPVVLYYYGQFPTAFLLTNIVVLPAAFVLVGWGFVVLLLAGTTTGVWLAKGLQLLATVVCRYVEWIERLPFATLPLEVTPWMLACLCAAIACLYAAVCYKRLIWIGAMSVMMTVFCCLYIDNVRARAYEQQLAVHDNYIYYRHNGTTDRHVVRRYAFFAYKGKTYVYAPNVSPRYQALLDAFCEEKHIQSYTTE